VLLGNALAMTKHGAYREFAERHETSPPREDATQIQQVLLNILLNACETLGAGTLVSIVIPAVRDAPDRA
jgi:nitrogen-specific signal transduction histidine kinase